METVMSDKKEIATMHIKISVDSTDLDEDLLALIAGTHLNKDTGMFDIQLNF